MFSTPCPTSIPGVKDGRTRRRICTKGGGLHYKQCVTPFECHHCQRDTARTNRQSHDDEVPAPSLATRILSYTQAVAEWLAAGQPERSDEEVQRIYKEQCEPCSWRKRRTDICRGCGCRVAAYGMAVLNKIKMATQHCPREKW